LDTSVLEIIKETLRTPRRIVIITHVNPDGDAIGSSLAFYHALKNDGHDVTVVVPNNYPLFLAWLPGSNEIIVHKKNPELAEKIILETELIFCLDFNDIKRMAKVSEAYTKSKAKKFLVDHHLEPSVFTDYAISVKETSSTSEIIFDLLDRIGKKHLIDLNAAECLYVGIITDTGSFSYACNYSKTYEAVQHFISLGIDGEHIHRLVYDTYSEGRLRLLGYCLSEKMKVFPEYGVAYISLTKEELRKFNYRIGDTEGVVNYTLSIEGIGVGFLFIERENVIKISLRSKGEISVNEIAKKYFNGGGHFNAAGGEICGNLDEQLKRFEALLPEITSK
jgi:bifunctional oligoribonuclease and PAP phosphatase NrnA